MSAAPVETQDEHAPVSTTRRVVANICNGLSLVFLALTFWVDYRITNRLAEATSAGGKPSGVDVYAAGERSGEVLAVPLMLLALAVYLTRRSSPVKKAAWRLVACAVFSFAVVGRLPSAPSPSKLSAQVASQLQELKGRQEAKAMELNKRFEQVHLESALDPRNLATPAGRAASKEKVAQFRALIAEGAALQQHGMEEAHQMIVALPDGEFKRGAEDGFQKAQPRTRKLMDDMQQGQTGMVDAADAIIDWSAAHARTLKLRDGRFVMSEAELGEWQAMFARLEDAAKRARVAAETLQANGADAARTLAKQSAGNPSGAD